MRHLMPWVTCALIVTSTAAVGGALRAATPSIRWESVPVKSASGTERSFELGHLSVPENRESGSARSIDLAFLRLPSTAEHPGPPIVFLSGGPGQPATPMVRSPGFLAGLEALLPIADVILLDQRGIGRSTPNLACPAEAPAPLDVFSDDPEAVEPLLRAAAACAERRRSEGIDVAAYNTRESADDLEDLRRALGAPKLDLIGFSYGTHLATAAIRRHGDHLGRVVLVGTEGPDDTWKLPSTFDTQLETISTLAAADPTIGKQMPDFAAVTRRVLARAAETPFSVAITSRDGEKLTLPVGRRGLQRILLWDIGDGNDVPWFPALVHQLDRGDTRTLAWFVRKRYPQVGAGIPLMSFAMDCASGISAPRRSRIEAEAPAATFGDVMNDLYETVCDAIGVPQLDPSFRAPIRSPVEALFVSGTIDSNTPPYQAEEIAWGMPNAHQLIVENAGHEDMLPDPRVQQAIGTFLATGELSTARVVLPRPAFVALDRVRE